MASSPVYNSPLPLLPSEIPTSAQEAAAKALGDDAPEQFKPYPTGSPLSLEDEKLRAIGELWKEKVT